MEGNWDSENTGWNLVVIPDREGEENVVQISVPLLGSVIVNHDLTASEPVEGMSDIPEEERPPIWWTFYGFRAMLASAGVISALAAASVVLRIRGQLYTARWFQWASLASMAAGVIGVIAGWITSEVGRQPYVVYGELATSDAASQLAPASVLFSVLLIFAVYTLLFGAYVRYLLRALKNGPEDPDADEDSTPDDTSPETRRRDEARVNAGNVPAGNVHVGREARR